MHLRGLGYTPNDSKDYKNKSLKTKMLTLKFVHIWMKEDEMFYKF